MSPCRDAAVNVEAEGREFGALLNNVFLKSQEIFFPRKQDFYHLPIVSLTFLK